MLKSAPFHLRRLSRLLTAYVSCGAIVITSILPAYADVVATPDGVGGTLTDTTISVSGDTSTITTGTISSGVGLNAFSEFSIDNGKTVDLVQPDGTNALVNVVNDISGAPATILGTLNTSKAGDATDVNSSKVFIVDHNGFLVGSTGTINANTLVLSTAQASVGSLIANGDSTALSQLMAGEEALDASANIEFQPGSSVNVAALELHAGAELILNGTISVDAPDQEGSGVAVAVNTTHLTQAKGASVQGGVIHFGAKNATIGGTARAKRGGQGGQISGRVSESLTVKAGAVLDVSGMGFDGGTILFGGSATGDFIGAIDSTLTFEAGAQIDASSDTQTGGFFFARAGMLGFGGDLDLAGGGAALLEARQTTFSGATTTNGGDIAVVSDARIEVAAGASITSTSTTIGGDISLIAPDISIGSGATLDADVVGADKGGLIALLATARQTEVGFPISDDGASAQISIDSATIAGGAVVISSYAKTANVVDETNAASVEAQTSAAETNDGVFTTAFNDLTSEIANLAAKGKELFSKKFPIQFKDVDATAVIAITNASIDARGNWKGAAAPDAADGNVADNGVLRKTGLQTRDYTALLGKPLTALTQLPNAFNATTDSLYVHANSETEISIKPVSFLLSTATTVTDTKSTVRIEGSSLAAIAGDVVLNSTVQDSLKIDILGSGIKGVAVAAVVATHNSVNQLLVLDGSVTANAGNIRAAALTGKSHNLSNRVGAGGGGIAATAVTVSLGSSFTEAALGGNLAAQNLDLDAETIYFEKSHETIATLGSAAGVSDAVPTSAASLAAKVGAEKAKNALLGGDDEDPTKNKLAIGLAVDIQLDTNQTFATLGGRYRDLVGGDVEKAMSAAVVTIDNAVTVDATQRFGRFDEGGQAINRTVQAQMQDLSNFLSKIPFGGGTLGQPNGGTDVALFGSLSMAQMAGSVRAEIGDGATVTASDVTVDALTQYQTVAQLTNFRDRWRVFTDELTKIDVEGTLTGSPSTVPDIDAATDGIVFITTSTGTKSVQTATALNDQKFAMGASVNLFETDNETEALIGDGAVIVTSGAVNVTAEQEAVFSHMAATANGNSRLSPTGSPSNLVGANVSVPRMLSRVVASVGNADITAGGDLNILAHNNVIQVGVSRAGGSAAKVAINGAISANIFETVTVARLGETATVSAEDIRIEAEDSSLLIALAGAKSGGTNLGVGASAVINLVKRDTRAEIGNVDTVNLAVNTGQRIDAQTLNIRAANTGVVFGSALAGSKVAGTAAGSAVAGAQDNDQQTYVPDALLDGSETSAVQAQSNVASAPDATGASRASGFAISGSVVLNLFQKNNATAAISTNSVVATTNTTSVLAENTALDIALAGSIAFGLGLDLGASALAGAVAVKKDDRNTRVILRGATITGQTIFADARDAARSVNVAVSGSGGKSTLAALAGSVTTNIEAGETLVQITDAMITAAVSQSFIARNQGQLFGISGGVSASVGGLLGIGLAVATNDSSRDAKTYVSGTSFGTGATSLRSLSELEVYGIAASGGYAKLSLGGSAVANTVSGSAVTQIDNSTLNGLNALVDSQSANELWAYTGNLGVAATAAIGGAVAINQHNGGAQAMVRNSVIIGNDITVSANATAELSARALALSSAPLAAVGIGIAVNRTAMSVLADVDSSDLLARGSISVGSNATANVNGLSFAGADGGTLAASGTATYNEANNTVQTLVRDQSGASRSRLYAKDSIAITSQADTNVELLGGRDKLPNLTGNITAAGTAGIGASITINTTNNQVTTSVVDETSVQAFGAGTVTTRLGEKRGVLIDAFASTDVDAMAISAGVAGSAALTGIFVYNTVSDDVATYVGDGLDVAINTVTGLDAALSTELSGTVDIFTALGGTEVLANAGQDVQVSAAVSNSIDNFALAVAAAGGVAVGASGSGNLIDSTATVTTNTATINAQNDIDVLADVYSRLTTYSLGAAGGKVAGAASVTYNAVKSAALVNLIGTGLSASGVVSVTSNVLSDLTSFTGNLAVGGGAGAGSVIVNILATQSEVRTTGTTVDRYNLLDNPAPGGPVGAISPTYVPGLIAAGGDVVINARTENIVANSAISGAVGGGFVAISSAINLVESQTKVIIAADHSIEGANVAISALEQSRLSDLVGVIAGGGAGVGGSLNYVDFAGNASVVIGARARIAATDALSVTAQADRDVDGMVGMASIAGSSLSAAISIINVGGKAIDESGEGSAMLSASSSALSDDPTNSNGNGSLGDMSARAGGTGTINALDADRTGANIAPAARVDNVGVVIGVDAQLVATGALDILAQNNTGIAQTVGVVSVSAAALSAAVGVTNLKSQASIEIQSGARVLSDGIITIGAGTAARPGKNSVESTVYSVAASVGVNAAAGVSIANANTQTSVDIADGVRIGTPTDASFGNVADATAALLLPSKVNIQSTRADTVTTTITNFGLSGGAAIGVAYAEANNSGSATISIGRAGGLATEINSGNVSIDAMDRSRVSATTTSAQGGTLAGISGAFSTTSNTGGTAVLLNRTAVEAATFALNNVSSARSLSEANGLALGALAIGVTIAEASFDATLTTDLNAVSVDAIEIEILTEVKKDGGDTNVVADALAGSGGLVAGGGAVARALSNYTVKTTIDGGADSVVATRLSAVNQAIVRTNASNFSSLATSSGLAVGALAVGVIIGEVGQKGTSAQVLTDVRSGVISGYGGVFIASDNTQIQTVDVTSGSGGLLTGSGAEANTYVNAKSETKIGDVGSVTLIAGDPLNPEDTRFNGELTVLASQDVTLGSRMDNTSASAVGLSAAIADTQINADVDVIIGSGAQTVANFYLINAYNAVNRPLTSNGIVSASGGGLVGAAIQSDVSGAVSTDVAINSGAQMVQIGNPSLAKRFSIGAEANLNVQDKLILDAGGVLAVPVGQSAIAIGQTGGVEIGSATIRAAGLLDIYSGANATLKAEAHSTTYGLAGAASSTTYATYNATNTVDILPNADLLSFTDIALRAGQGSGGEQRVSVDAESRSFNNTAIPIDIDPIANAYSAVQANVNIGAASKVIAYQNIDLIASGGRRDVRGFGLGKDFYKAVLEGAASLVGTSLVLDIKTGNTTDISNGTIDVNGQVRSGAFNRRVLYLDDNDVPNNALLETETDSGIYESNVNAPDPSLYLVEQNVDLSIVIQARINTLDAQIADPATSPADTARYQASRVILLGRLSDLAGELSSVITVEYLRASEGSVRIEGDVLTGSATGSLYAASEAEIRVHSTSGAQLNIIGLEIADVEGGEITFNEALIEAGTPDYAFDVSFGQVVDGQNTISVITNEPFGGAPNVAALGNIDILGAVANYTGDVVFNTEQGSITQSAPVSAENFTAKAPKGSINIGPNEGIDNRGGSPTITYSNLVNWNEGYSNYLFNRGVTANFGRNDYYYARSGRILTGGFNYVAPDGITTAGRSISLLAEYTNINTLLRAGTGSYVVDIGAGIDGLVASLKSQGGTGRVRLDNLASESRNGVIRTAHISNNTNAEIYYNYETDQIEVEDMKVRGGAIYIVSNVISTGFGALEAIDGYGSLALNSAAQTDVVLNSVDLGGSANGAALEGLVRITDLSKYSNYTGGGPAPFLTTDYRSVGGLVSIYDNNALPGGLSGEETIQDPFGNDIIRPARLISGPTAGSSFSYTPVQNRDYVAVTEKTRLVKMDQFDVAILHGNGSTINDPAFSVWYREQKIKESDAGIISGSENTILSASLSDPLVRYSLGGSDYAYNYDHTRRSYRLAQGAHSYTFVDYNNKSHTINLNPSLHGLADQVANPFDDRTGKINAGFERIYNIWPGNQSYYSLIYDIEPGLRSSERELNIRHKIIDKRSALFVETERHEHRFKADHSIAIKFSGSQTAGTTINTNGNVILSEDLFNRFATTSITSQNGSILSTQNKVQISAADLNLSAANGSIGGLGGPLRLDLTEDTNTSDNVVTPGVLSAVAGTGIDVFEISGDLHLKELRTTGRGVADFGAQIGAISVKAQGDVIQTDDASVFEGSDISLTSLSGSIYRDAVAGPEAVQIDTEFGRLDASAQGDITVRETVGDLGLGTVNSVTDNVTLEVPTGRLLDRNNFELRDTRTLAELNTLWSKELALTEGTPEYTARLNAQIAAYEGRYTSAYGAYWEKRNAGGGAGNVVFTLDPALEADMRASALSDATVDAYIAEFAALYVQWNDELSYDPAYAYTASSAEIADLTAGSIWTAEALTTSIRAGLVLETGDTNVRVEDANIVAAGDIIITARDGIGEIKDPYVLVKPLPGASLTANDLAVLALADKDDFDIDGDGVPDLDANGNSLIRQEEDLNFAFTEDLNGKATGSLRLTSAFNEIYLAAETAAEISKIHGTGAVELRIDGIMTNAEVETFAVAGQNVLLESGTTSAIGEAGKALTVNILPGGALTARSGTDLYISAPSGAGVAGDLPIAALFAGDLLSLTAAGAITDAIGSGLERIAAGSIEITGASVGTDTTPLGLGLIDAELGTASITSTVGDINIFTARDLTLGGFQSAAGGRLATTGGAALALSGTSPIRFAGDRVFTLDLDGALNTEAVTGPAIAGGQLDVVSRIGFGNKANPLSTQIANLNFAPSVATAAGAPLSVWFANTGNLTVGTFQQTTSALSQSGVSATGDLTFGTISTAGLLDFDSGGTLDIASATARRLELTVGAAIGASSAMSLSVDELDLMTFAGNARANLIGRDVAIDRAHVGGTGSLLDLTITGGDTVIRGAGIASDGAAKITSDRDVSFAANTQHQTATAFEVTTTGNIVTDDSVQLQAGNSVALSGQDITAGESLAVTSGGQASIVAAGAFIATTRFAVATEGTFGLTGQTVSLGSDGNIISRNGDLFVTAQVGDLSFGQNTQVVAKAGDIKIESAAATRMAAGSQINAQTGTVAVNVGTDLTAALISTGNATDAALSVMVGGTLDATTPSQDTLVANTNGAGTILRAGQVPAVGPTGLNVALDNLNARVEAGDLHLHEADEIKLQDINVATGSFDLFSDGAVTVGKVSARDSIVISAQSDVLSDGAILTAAEAYLFAFGGSVAGTSGGQFIGDTKAGSALNLHARDDVLYSESIGSVDIGYALASTGDLSLDTLQNGATMSVGLPGAGGTMTLASGGDVTINILGGGQIDLIDETLRALVIRGANPYGLVDVAAPEALNIRASGAGSKLTIGLINAKGGVDLQADIIDANIYDETPADGLDLRLSGIDGAMAQFVDVDVIADGSVDLLTPPFAVPDLSDRLIAEIRPADPTLATSDSIVTLSFGRFANGEVTNAGPALNAVDVVISGEAWFRQKTFDLYANTFFGGINLDADAQILALALDGGKLVAGHVSFELFDDRQIATDKLVINRKLEDVGLNGVRSFFEGALTELVLNLNSEDEGAGKTALERLEAYLKFLAESDAIRSNSGTLVLPLVIASN